MNNYHVASQVITHFTSNTHPSQVTGYRTPLLHEAITLTSQPPAQCVYHAAGPTQAHGTGTEGIPANLNEPRH